MKEVRVIFLGRIPYKEAWDVQKKLVQQKLQDLQEKKNTPHWLLLCEHPPVITLGKNAKTQHILLPPPVLQEKGIELYHVERGGDVTYHGPGQLVGYPILHLEAFRADVGWYMRALEETIIRLLGQWKLQAVRFPPYTGVWLPNPPRKIAAQGVKLTRWVSMHGFALNVSVDLTPFQWIIPCGISHKPVTSMQRELGYAPSIEEVATAYVKYFSEVFEASTHVEVWPSFPLP